MDNRNNAEGPDPITPPPSYEDVMDPQYGKDHYQSHSSVVITEQPGKYIYTYTSSF